MKISEIIFDYVSPTTATLIVIMNSIEIIIIFKSKGYKRLSSGMMFLLNLSMSDLFIGVIIIAVKILTAFAKSSVKEHEVVMIVLHILRYYMLRLSLFISILCLMALAFLRMLAVRKPFLYHKLTQKVAIKVCIATWVIPILCLTILYTAVRLVVGLERYDKYGDVIFPIVTYSASVVFVSCYYTIVYSLRKQKARILSQIDPTMLSAYRKVSADCRLHGHKAEKIKNVPFQESANSKIMELAWKNIAAFHICWLPIATFAIVKISGIVDSWQHAKDVQYLLISLAFLNSAIDPILYCHFMRKFLIKKLYTLLGKSVNDSCLLSEANSNKEIISKGQYESTIQTSFRNISIIETSLQSCNDMTTK